MKNSAILAIYATSCLLAAVALAQENFPTPPDAAPSGPTGGFTGAGDTAGTGRQVIIQPLNSGASGAPAPASTTRRTIVQSAAGSSRGGASGARGRGSAPSRGGAAAAVGSTVVGTPTVAASNTPPKPQLPSLKENIHLEVKGELVDNYPVDFSLTGIGPDFTINFMLRPTAEAPAEAKSDPTGPAPAPSFVMASLQATVTEGDSGYQVVFSLGYSVPYVVERGSGSSTQSTVQYRNETTKSVVLVKPDSTVEVAAANGKKVTVSISKPPAK